MTFAIDTPMLSIEEYARRTGVTVISVRKQCEKGHLPFIQCEERGTRYINMVQLTQRCLEANAGKPWN
jgi:hypothetical protein